MKRLLLLGILALAATACSSSVSGSVASSSLAPTTQLAPTPVATQAQTPGPTPAATKAQTPRPTATATPAPSDVPFTIDCSSLPKSREADCAAFLATTRDVVYPIERELTGVSLSKCYKQIHYVILATDPGSGAGGLSFGDTIKLNKAYSIDLSHPYDVHELLHSISTCAKALDNHAFHGMIMNAVYARLGVHDAGFFEDRSAVNLNAAIPDLQAQAAKATGAERTGLCSGLVSRKMTIAYFDLGAGAITSLYRSTIPPVKNTTSPSAALKQVWGGYAPQLEALQETLKAEFKYSIAVPECGL